MVVVVGLGEWLGWVVEFCGWVLWMCGFIGWLCLDNLDHWLLCVWEAVGHWYDRGW